MQNSIYKIKYLLFLSWDWEAWCLTVWGVIHPPERNTAWNKGRKCFHCLVAPNNLIRPWNWPTSNFYLRPAHTSSLNYPLPIGALLGNPTLLCLSLKVPGKRDPPRVSFTGDFEGQTKKGSGKGASLSVELSERNLEVRLLYWELYS